MPADEAHRIRRHLAEYGVPAIIDVHTHFMPAPVINKVWAYFDSVGPLTGRPWPITYRHSETERIETLRAFGVRTFTSLTATDADPQPAWTLRQLAIIAIADAIVDRRPFTDDETELIWEELGAAERTEFIALAALYLGIAAQCIALQIPVEPRTPSLPTAR